FPELIDLYANNPVADIAGLPAHIALCGLHQGNKQFETQRCKAEKLKNQLEGAIGDEGTFQEQIRAALKLLEASRESADFDWYYALIGAGYKRRWRDDDQRDYFDWAAGTIRAGNDFFLSFTSRPHDEASVQKPVNRRYWHFIRSVIRVETYSPEEQRD